ncbi:MAG: nucleotide exchange factor GrpE [Streptosporangiales bacterium]|nr:nucleotide exchange factor GrpE [Streptosporangiales bacterium]
MTPATGPEGPSPEEQGGFVFRDRRRIDPETGEVRTPEQEPAGESAPAAGGAATGEPPADGDEVADLRMALAERTADVQRVQAEYVNYRRRVDRDREALKAETTGKVLGALLPVLDDLDRAREHGELEGGFKAVAEALERITSGLGLERYGAEGEPFDPTVHEALTHEYSADVDGIVATRIYQPGYRVGTRILRAARVAVTEAEGGAVPASVEGALTLDDTPGDEATGGDSTTS